MRQAIVLLLICAGCATWRGKVEENGYTVKELACARTFIVSGTPRMGFPLLPMDPKDADQIAQRIEGSIPELRRVPREFDADIIVSVLFAPSLPICDHCDRKPDTEWSAMVVRGHNPERFDYMYFGGKVVIGTDARGAFVNQLQNTLRQGRCGG